MGPIPCQDMLNAALDRLTASVVRHNHDQCQNFAGFSSSGSVTHAIRSAPHGTTLVFLTYVWVRTALKLVPVRLYECGSCGEVELRLRYINERIGRGSIRLSDFDYRKKVTIRRSGSMASSGSAKGLERQILG